MSGKGSKKPGTKTRIKKKDSSTKSSKGDKVETAAYKGSQIQEVVKWTVKATKDNGPVELLLQCWVKKGPLKPALEVISLKSEQFEFVLPNQIVMEQEDAELPEDCMLLKLTKPAKITRFIYVLEVKKIVDISTFEGKKRRLFSSDPKLKTWWALNLDFINIAHKLGTDDLTALTSHCAGESWGLHANWQGIWQKLMMGLLEKTSAAANLYSAKKPPTATKLKLADPKEMLPLIQHMRENYFEWDVDEEDNEGIPNIYEDLEGKMGQGPIRRVVSQGSGGGGRGGERSSSSGSSSSSSSSSSSGSGADNGQSGRSMVLDSRGTLFQVEGSKPDESEEEASQGVGVQLGKKKQKTVSPVAKKMLDLDAVESDGDDEDGQRPKPKPGRKKGQGKSAKRQAEPSQSPHSQELSVARSSSSKARMSQLESESEEEENGETGKVVEEEEESEDSDEEEQSGSFSGMKVSGRGKQVVGEGLKKMMLLERLSLLGDRCIPNSYIVNVPPGSWQARPLMQAQVQLILERMIRDLSATETMPAIPEMCLLAVMLTEKGKKAWKLADTWEDKSNIFKNKKNWEHIKSKDVWHANMPKPFFREGFEIVQALHDDLSVENFMKVMEWSPEQKTTLHRNIRFIAIGGNHFMAATRELLRLHPEAARKVPQFMWPKGKLYVNLTNDQLALMAQQHNLNQEVAMPTSFQGKLQSLRYKLLEQESLKPLFKVSSDSSWSYEVSPTTVNKVISAQRAFQMVIEAQLMEPPTAEMKAAEALEDKALVESKGGKGRKPTTARMTRMASSYAYERMALLEPRSWDLLTEIYKLCEASAWAQAAAKKGTLKELLDTKKFPLKPQSFYKQLVTSLTRDQQYDFLVAVLKDLKERESLVAANKLKLAGTVDTVINKHLTELKATKLEAVIIDMLSYQWPQLGADLKNRDSTDTPLEVVFEFFGPGLKLSTWEEIRNDNKNNSKVTAKTVTAAKACQVFNQWAYKNVFEEAFTRKDKMIAWIDAQNEEAEQCLKSGGDFDVNKWKFLDATKPVGTELLPPPPDRIVKNKVKKQKQQLFHAIQLEGSQHFLFYGTEANLVALSDLPLDRVEGANEVQVAEYNLRDDHLLPAYKPKFAYSSDAWGKFAGILEESLDDDDLGAYAFRKEPGQETYRYDIRLFISNPPWGWGLADWDMKAWTLEDFMLLFMNAKAMTFAENWVFLVTVPYDQVNRVQLAFELTGFLTSFPLHVRSPWAQNTGNPFTVNAQFPIVVGLFKKEAEVKDRFCPMNVKELLEWTPGPSSQRGHDTAKFLNKLQVGELAKSGCTLYQKSMGPKKARAEADNPAQDNVNTWRALIRSFMPKQHKKSGVLVADMCAGSGTGALACAQEGLNSLSIDVDSSQMEAVQTRVAKWKAQLKNDIRQTVKQDFEEAGKILIAGYNPDIWELLHKFPRLIELEKWRNRNDEDRSEEEEEDEEEQGKKDEAHRPLRQVVSSSSSSSSSSSTQGSSAQSAQSNEAARRQRAAEKRLAAQKKAVAKQVEEAKKQNEIDRAKKRQEEEAVQEEEEEVELESVEGTMDEVEDMEVRGKDNEDEPEPLEQRGKTIVDTVSIDTNAMFASAVADAQNDKTPPQKKRRLRKEKDAAGLTEVLEEAKKAKELAAGGAAGLMLSPPVEPIAVTGTAPETIERWVKQTGRPKEWVSKPANEAAIKKGYAKGTDEYVERQRQKDEETKQREAKRQAAVAKSAELAKKSGEGSSGKGKQATIMSFTVDKSTLPQKEATPATAEGSPKTRARTLADKGAKVDKNPSPKKKQKTAAGNDK